MTTIRLAISADCHVNEPLGLWQDRLPNALRDRAPRVEQRGEYRVLLAEDQVIRRFRSPPGAGIFGSDGHGGDDVASRLAALDRDGVHAEVMYPNLAFFCTYAIRDPVLQSAVCQIYNDWVSEQFAANPRLAPVGLLPVRDVSLAIKELERCERLGLRAGLLPAHADFRPYNDEVYEPLWEAAAGTMPLSFHAGTGRSQTPAHGPGGAIVNYVVTVGAPMETVAYLCGSGVLERHPELRVTMVECGSGWLAWTLDAMDDAYREHHMFVRPKLRELPSDYFRRQGYVTFQRDAVGLSNLRHTGAHCLMWGSDYPHPEGTYPDSRRILREQFADLPQDTVDAIVFRNAAELYRFALPETSNGPS